MDTQHQHPLATQHQHLLATHHAAARHHHHTAWNFAWAMTTFHQLHGYHHDELAAWQSDGTSPTSNRSPCPSVCHSRRDRHDRDGRSRRSALVARARGTA
ncbi:hypothetical protein [Saccharothrix xinjiangensis]|uniref:Uncharacterized protein n=1 Tax=Saccharothrix xinjiangensis TaxID=204798 RepID=A0ABV9Y1U2_9PSEU